MITVRFPDGTAIQYNNATKMIYNGTNARLLKADGTWVADVMATAGAVIESVAPCKVYNPTKHERLSEMVDWILARRSLSYSEAEQLSRLKAGLAEFDAKRKCWKEKA